MAASPSHSPDDQFAIGSVLDDRYRIAAVLGTGGMGRVYRAEHTESGRPVAIKVLHADLTRNREASQRFQRELLATGLLNHPNIVGFSESGEYDGACYLVMELLEGESLGERLVREHRIPWPDALDILRGVLHGLGHAHECGVVHRDIKPDNVYLTHKDGEPVIKILDFGIAKLVAGTADDPASTRAGLTVGTPAYLSPEQAVGGEITPASDLYSASVVLYEMLAGRAPFEDKDPLAMLGAHVSRPPPRFVDVAPGIDVPAPLEAIVQRGLRKPAAERIRTAAEYLALLDDAFPPRPQRSRPASAPVIDQAAAIGSTRTALPARIASRATPAPDTSTAVAAPAISVEMAQLPRAARAVSLVDASEPIPLTWIMRSGVVIGLMIIAAMALAIGAHCRGAEPSAKPESGSASPAAAPDPKPETPAKPAAAPAASPPSEAPAPARPSSPPAKPSAAKPAPPPAKPHHR